MVRLQQASELLCTARGHSCFHSLLTLITRGIFLSSRKQPLSRLATSERKQTGWQNSDTGWKRFLPEAANPSVWDFRSPREPDVLQSLGTVEMIFIRLKMRFTAWCLIGFPNFVWTTNTDPFLTNMYSDRKAAAEAKFYPWNADSMQWVTVEFSGIFFLNESPIALQQIQGQTRCRN